MQLVQDEYMESLDSISTQQAPTSCRMYSSVTGLMAHSDELGPGYWVRNLVSPVLFSTAIQELVRPTLRGKRVRSNAVDVLIEIGPHPALETPTLQSLEAIDVTNLPYLSPLVREKDAIDTAMTLAGQMLNLGARIDLLAVNGIGESGEEPAKLLTDQPSYPWNHSQMHWGESRMARHYRQRQESPNTLLGVPLPIISPGFRQWRSIIDLSHQSWIADHNILGSILFPGAGYLVMAIEAILQVLSPSPLATLRLKNVQFLSALELSNGTGTECTMTLQSTSPVGAFTTSSWVHFVIASFPDGNNAVNNCTGSIQIEEAAEEIGERSTKNEEDYLAAVTDCQLAIETKRFYTSLGKLGLQYGPNFALVTSLRNRPEQCCFSVTMPESRSDKAGFFNVIHPTLLDAIVHAGFAAIDTDTDKMRAVMLPSQIEQMVVSLNHPESMVPAMAGQCTMTNDSKTQVTADFTVVDPSNHSVAIQMVGFVFTEVPTAPTTLAPTGKLCSRSLSMPAINFLTLQQQRAFLQSTDGNIYDKLSKVRISLSLQSNLLEHRARTEGLQPPPPIFRLYVESTKSFACQEERLSKFGTLTLPEVLRSRLGVSILGS